jgi:hypothetical protein
MRKVMGLALLAVVVFVSTGWSTQDPHLAVGDAQASGIPVEEVVSDLATTDSPTSEVVLDPMDGTVPLFPMECSSNCQSQAGGSCYIPNQVIPCFDLASGQCRCLCCTAGQWEGPLFCAPEE